MNAIFSAPILIWGKKKPLPGIFLRWLLLLCYIQTVLEAKRYLVLIRLDYNSAIKVPLPLL